MRLQEDIAPSAPHAVVSALLAAVVSGSIVIAPSVLDGGGSLANWGLLLVLATFSVTSAHAIIFGLPAFLILRKLKLMRLWIFAAAGCLIGSLPWLAFKLFAADIMSPSTYFGVAILGCLGAIGGITFFLSLKYLFGKTRHG